MVRHTIFCESFGGPGDVVVPDREEAAHLFRVFRAASGDEVELLDGRGRRRPLTRKRKRKQRGSFVPVIGDKRLTATLHVGLEGDGASTVEALGLVYALLKALGQGYGVDLVLRPAPCFDKTVCALELSGIGRFVLAQNILEYLKGNHIHAKR